MRGFLTEFYRASKVSSSAKEGYKGEEFKVLNA